MSVAKKIVLHFFIFFSLLSIPVMTLFSDESKIVFSGKEIELSTDFDNGGMARIEEKETNVFECWPYEEENYRDGWLYLKSQKWESIYDHTGFCFHFHITGCKNKTITFKFHVKDRQDKDVTSVLYANPDFPVYSYDGYTWKRTVQKSLKTDPADSLWSIVTVKQFFEEDTAYISYQYPYSGRYLDRLIERIRYSPFCTIETAGQSTDGREIKQISITNPGTNPDKKLVIWIFGLQHSSELAAGFGIEAMIEYLVTDEPLAKKARDIYIFKIIPVVNIDAVNEGRGRLHRLRKNLNRLWEEDTSIIEVKSIKTTFDNWVEQGNRIDLLIDFHGFTSQNGEWTLLMPEEAYSIEMSDKYKKLIEILIKNLPKAKPGLKSIPGLSCNAGLRKYGAISMCIDGYIYNWQIKSTDLSSYYDSGDEIWPLEDVQACAKIYVEALIEYADWLTKTGVTEPKRLNIDLYQNYPNPFNNRTTISYKIPEPMHVTLRIYNSAGQTVKTIIDEYLKSGMYTASWNGYDSFGREVESGVYFVRIHAGNNKAARKIMLLK